MGEDLEKIFDALGHRIRRRVIEVLGKRGSATYSELMKAVGVEDSGTFAFHLRKLLDLGLVRKNERGEYELTDLGKRAYSMIKVLQGERAAYPQLSTVPETRVEAREPILIAETVRFVLTKSMAENLRRDRRKIRIQRVTKVSIEPMPRELLEEVLESIEDCSVVEAPSELMDIVMSRSRNVMIYKDLRTDRRVTLVVGKGWDRAISESLSKLTTQLASLGPRIASAVITSIMSSVPRIVEATSRLFGTVQESRIELPNNIKRINLQVNTSFIIVKPSDRAELIVKKRGDLGDVGIDTHNGDLEVSADTVEVELRVPPHLEELRVTCDSSTLSIEDIAVQSIVLKANSSSINLRRLLITKKLSAWLDAVVLSASTRIEPVDQSIIDLSADSTIIQLDVSLPRDAKVSMSSLVHESSVVDTEIDGTKVGLDYREPGYDEASRKLSIKLDMEDSVLRARVKHEQ